MAPSTASDTRAPALVVLAIAIAASVPALWLPLLSDDWTNLAAVSDGVPWRTPYLYVRPVFLAILRLGHVFWGITAWPYHAISVVLFASCALLAFTLVRRLTGDRGLALGAGILFALQPFSIEATAWVSSQADLLACAFALGCLLAWVSWRSSGNPVTLAGVVVAFVMALLSKESAVVVPPLIALIEWAGPRKTTRAAILAIAGLAAVATAHILFVRPHLLGIDGVALPVASARNVVGAATGFLTAIALPLPGELLEMHRLGMALLAVGLLVVFALAAKRGSHQIPRMAWLAMAAAAVAALPGLFSLQQRYFLIATVGTSVAFAVLIKACGRKPRIIAIATIAVIWCASAVLQWTGWFAAGRASVALVAGLTREASDPNVREIVIVNQPHRVRGIGVVSMDMTNVVEVVTSRTIPVSLGCRVDTFDSTEDGLDTGEGHGVAREGDDIVVHLRVPSTLYRRFVRPVVPIGQTAGTQGGGSVSRLDHERYAVRIPRRASEGRSVVVWKAGELVRATTLLSKP